MWAAVPPAPPLRDAQERFLARWMRSAGLGAALDRGLGKTRAAQLGMKLRFEVDKWLVTAPGRVARMVWRQEAAKWGDLDPNRMRVLWPTDFDMWSPQRPDDAPADWRPPGAPVDWREGELLFRDMRETRRHIRGLIKENDVIICPWNWVFQLSEVLVTGPGRSPFQGFVGDESGYARNKDTLTWRGARRFAAQAQGARLPMNGVPIVRDWEGLWAQSYLIDEGEALGRGLNEFREQFMAPSSFGPGGHVRDWAPTRPGLEQLHERFHQLWVAELRDDDMGFEYEVPCELGAEHWTAASKFLRGAIAECEGHKILPLNAGVGWSKALQVCNGRVYDEHKNVIELHSHKLDALADVVEGAERGVLVLAWWDHDHAAILRMLGRRHAVSVKEKNGLETWMAGKAKVLVSHPRPVGHGLNLQDYGHTAVWFGVHPDLELYLQANARFPREGQTHAVMLPRLLSQHPAEQAAWETLCGRGTALENLMKWKDKL